MKKFSTLLLTGKAATLPLLIQQARAEIQPSYTDILSTQITQIQVPVNNQVKLDSLGGVSSTYGTSYGGATICSEAGVSQLSVVITGLRDGETAVLLTSTAMGGLESYNAEIKVGAANLMVPVYTEISAPANGTVTLSVPIDLTRMTQNGYSLAQGGQFYMQSIALPRGSVTPLNFSNARVSELDVVSISSCSTYGGSAYGGTY